VKAKLVYHVREYLTEDSFQEIKIWQVPRSQGRPYGIKYSFVYIVEGERVIGYDNYEQKGDHRHFGGKETPYKLVSLEKLWKDFKKDIDRFRGE
jgi:hypothetical protein